MNLTDLINLNTTGIYGLVNKVDKRIYIFQTTNIYTYISRLIYETKYKLHKYKSLFDDLNKLYLICFSNSDDEIYRRIRVGELMDKFKSINWEIYNNDHKPLKFKIRKRNFYFEKQYVIGVELVNRKRIGMVVGLFENHFEADRFIELFYGEKNNYLYPVFSGNSLTIKYIREKHNYEVPKM